MRSATLLSLIMCVVPAYGASVSGVVLDGANMPLAGTTVYLECGIEAALVQTMTDEAGRYSFPSATGEACGVFAVATGKASDGYTLRAPGDEAITGPPIVLSESGSVSGVVRNTAGQPVEGAQIARVVLMSGEKVGIPLGKLRAYGVEAPATDAKGRFEVPGLPKGRTVALKVIHPLYAQRAVDGVAVGDDRVKVEMSPGVIVQGKVLVREARQPVANAVVQFWNAAPPHDTALVYADRQGVYAVRLEPGLYRGRAFARGYASANWQRLTVTGERAEQEMTLLIAGQGAIRGSVMDAVTGGPVQGARLVLISDGSTAAATKTGADGVFMLEAVEGENTLRLEEAPGYLPPESPGVEATVVSGATLELPAFWLAPVPRYELHIVDLEGQPVANAAVSLLEPMQFGWRFSDQNGVVEIQLGRTPASNSVVGMVEGPKGNTSALFAVGSADREPALVQLRPVGFVEGGVMGAGDTPLSGAIITAWTVSGEEAEPLAVWRTVSGPDGRFAWPAVAADTPHRASVATDAGQAEQSLAFRLPVGGRTDAGTVTVAEGASRTSMKGKRLEWWALPRLSGAEPQKNRPAVVLYCAAAEAPAVVEACSAARQILGGAPEFVVVADGPASVSETTVPLLQGAPPGPATTYVVDEEGVVVLETFGMPPVRALYGGEEQ